MVDPYPKFGLAGKDLSRTALAAAILNYVFDRSACVVIS